MTSRASRMTLVELHVPDLALAKRFYGRFGLQVARYEPARGGDGYLVLRHGDVIMCFWGGADTVRRHEYFGRFPRTAKRGYAVEIVLPVANVVRAYSVAKRARCVVAGLQLRRWGARDFRIEDPFGFYVRITEPHDVLAEGPRGERRQVRAPRARAPQRR